MPLNFRLHQSSTFLASSENLAFSTHIIKYFLFSVHFIIHFPEERIATATIPFNNIILRLQSPHQKSQAFSLSNTITKHTKPISHKTPFSNQNPPFTSPTPPHKPATPPPHTPATPPPPQPQTQTPHPYSPSPSPLSPPPSHTPEDDPHISPPLPARHRRHAALPPPSEDGHCAALSPLFPRPFWRLFRLSGGPGRGRRGLWFREVRGGVRLCGGRRGGG